VEVADLQHADPPARERERNSGSLRGREREKESSLDVEDLQFVDPRARERQRENKKEKATEDFGPAQSIEIE